MSRNTGYSQYILEEIFPPFLSITSRSMFGGYGIYRNGVIFGLIIHDQLYFKVNEKSRKNYEDRESKPFSYQGKNKKMISLSYYEVPLEIMEDKEQILEWIETACEVGKLQKK